MGNPQGKKQLGRPISKWMGNITIDREEKKDMAVYTGLI
jgi:hypothetical protein